MRPTTAIGGHGASFGMPNLRRIAEALAAHFWASYEGCKPLRGTSLRELLDAVGDLNTHGRPSVGALWTLSKRKRQPRCNTRRPVPLLSLAVQLNRRASAAVRRFTRNRALLGSVPVGQVTFKLRKGVNVGDVDAEYDKYLANAFLDTGDPEILCDTSSPKSVIVGRTGAGKTALLKHIEQTQERVLRIDPSTLSLQYLSNSTIIPYLADIGVKLDLFYALLWRHVLVMEIIREHFQLRDDAGQKNFFNRIAEFFSGNKAEQHAIEYYREWNPSFWESSDVRVKEITDALKQKLEAKLGKGFASAGASSERETKVTAETIQRAQGVIKDVSLERIQMGMQIVQRKVLQDRQRPYYVIIDDLDKNWVDAALSYDLIDALLDAVGEFAKIENVKVLVALRENIVEILHSRRGGQRQQREKHESLFHRLRWSEADLVSLMDKRLSEMLRAQYGGGVTLGQVLPDARMGKGLSGLEYMLERTLQRPRDLIEFVNRCLEQALTVQSGRITWKILLDAERDYSLGRLRSLEDEWHPTYPDIAVVFRAFDGSPESFVIADLDDNRLIQTLITGEHSDEQGSIAKLAYDLSESGRRAGEVWLALMSPLYRVGFVGAKAAPQDPVVFSYQQPSLSVEHLPLTARFYVHKALHSALHIQTQRK